MKKDKEIEIINNRISFNFDELSEAGRRSLTSVPLKNKGKLSISPKAKEKIKSTKIDLIKQFNIITD